MITSKPMTMADAARYLQGRAHFPTLAAATAFLRDVRDDSRMHHPGTGDRPEYSVDYTAQRRFVVMEDEPGDPWAAPAPSRLGTTRTYRHHVPAKPNARRRRLMRNGWAIRQARA